MTDFRILARDGRHCKTRWGAVEDAAYALKNCTSEDNVQAASIVHLSIVVNDLSDYGCYNATAIAILTCSADGQ